MAADTDKALRMLRLIAGHDVDLYVFHGEGVYEIEATQGGKTYSLKGDNLLKLAVELHRKVGFKVDGQQ